MTRVPLPDRDDPTLDAIETAVENNHRSDVRNYLGWSGLQHPCERSVQYDFLMALPRYSRPAPCLSLKTGTTLKSESTDVFVYCRHL